MDTAADHTSKSRRSSWKKDPEAVKRDILTIATEEFAANGLSGANINVIAQRTSTSKRMIYYYFDDKEGLYRAVLDEVYAALRMRERQLNVDGLDPVAALRQLTIATYEAHATAPHFVRLVMIENIHNADYLKKSEVVRALNETIIEKLASVCERGIRAGLFRKGADALQLHWIISAPSFYNISNRATFEISFGNALFTDTTQNELKNRIVDMVLSAVVIGYEATAWDMP